MTEQTENLTLEGWAAAQYEPYEFPQEKLLELQALFVPVGEFLVANKIPFGFLVQSALNRDGGVAINGSTFMGPIGRTGVDMLNLAMISGQDLSAEEVFIMLAQAFQAKAENQIVI